MINKILLIKLIITLTLINITTNQYTEDHIARKISPHQHQNKVIIDPENYLSENSKHQILQSMDITP